MDLIVNYLGSICLLTPVSEHGEAWVAENVTITEETQYWGSAIVVEPRYIGDIMIGADRDGLVIEGSAS